MFFLDNTEILRHGTPRVPSDYHVWIISAEAPAVAWFERSHAHNGAGPADRDDEFVWAGLCGAIPISVEKGDSMGATENKSAVA